MRVGKVVSKDEVTGEMVKDGDDMVVDWIWRLCNVAFESDVVSEDWRFFVIVPLNKGRREKTECKNHRAISLLAWLEKYIEEY